MMNAFKIILIAGAVFPLTLTTSYAGDMKGNLYAMTNVMPSIKYVIHHKAGNITVTQKDIERGYVDVQKALVYSMTTNSTNGHLLIFAYDGNYIKRLTIFDEKNAYHISESDGEVHMPDQGNGYITKELTFRLHLLSDAKPGIYRMPVEVMLSAM